MTVSVTIGGPVAAMVAAAALTVTGSVYLAVRVVDGQQDSYSRQLRQDQERIVERQADLNRKAELDQILLPTPQPPTQHDIDEAVREYLGEN